MKKADRLNEVYRQVELKTARETDYPPEELVLGSGSDSSEIVLIGEAPGATEVEQHRPFAGKAGRNLDEFLALTGVSRDRLFITNVVKRRPYKEKNGRRSNRPPTRSEVEFYRECLEAELEIISPKIVVTLGNTALRAISMQKSATIGEFHGKLSDVGRSCPMFALYHPASVIYNQALREVYLEDLQKLREVLRQL